MASSKLVFICFCALVLCLCASAAQVTHDSRAITIDGKRRILISGSIHYPRSTVEMWPDLIKKAKDGGLDAIETYVFWNAHEPHRRQYDFTGNLDLVRFIQTIQDEGLYAVLRIGPYVCAEWNYGGFPVWLHNMPGIELRTVNKVFMNEMQNFTTMIVNMMKDNKLFASQGGPIILAQIENEYGNVMSSYGAAGKAYIDWCAHMADSLNIGVPWVMCQQRDAPKPMLETCNGFYCDQYKPSDPNTPKMWTENWTGWFKSWGGKDPHRTAEDLAFAVARFFQLGGTFQNYYMYHGGTNFGRTAGGPYITTSYDYDAPLDEYGNLNQPKWGHLKQLHEILHSMEHTLTYGKVSGHDDYCNKVSTNTYTTENGSSCFIANWNDKNDAVVNFQGAEYHVPAWSVSILVDCKTVAYNTAQVNTQTSVMVKKPNQAENEPSSLVWSWRPENTDNTVLLGRGNVQVKQILDQKTAANDDSDYLWYMTSLDLKKDDIVWSNNMKIRINCTGNVLHTYVNGEYLGSEWAKYGVNNYIFEKDVKLRPGKNQISILSATVGLQNYGAFFDMTRNGIFGSVQVIGYRGEETVIKELAAHTWSYKTELHGSNNQLFDLDSKKLTSFKWAEGNLPINRRMTWYKTTFKAPLGTDPVVLNLQGMGKGYAWVNGKNIGRYWPSFITEEGCPSGPCDYRGAYNGNKCVTNCGQPTQIWYHVPRSFLAEDVNTLVLFEEFGGNPSNVNFQTTVVGSACAHAYDQNAIELSCQGHPIMDIKFASYGNPQGTCGSFVKGTCESTNDALEIIKKTCVGNESCTIKISEETFGSTNCDANVAKRLAVEAVC